MRKNEFLVPNKKACDECLCNNGLRNCRYPIQIVSIAPLNTLQMSYQKLLGSFHLKSEQRSLIWVLLDCFTGLSLVSTDHVTSIQGCHWSYQSFTILHHWYEESAGKLLQSHSCKIFTEVQPENIPNSHFTWQYSSSIWTVATKRKFEGQFGGYCRGQQI